MVDPVAALILAAFVFMMIRNWFVWRVQIRAIDAGLDVYDQLPAYPVMLVQVWRWNYRVTR